MNDRNLGKVVGGGGDFLGHFLFERLTSPGFLLASWDEFRVGKESKGDVQEFGIYLEENLFALRERLLSGSYQHGGYSSFYLTDPKLRHIHKPAVSDRVLHHALVRLIEPLFEPMFIHDSYSSREGKGTHRAVERLREFAWRASCHDRRMVWALKCDVRRFFDSVDQERLLALLRKRINDRKILWLLEEVIKSFETSPGKGIPLGNLTSQLFSNIYLNELDQYVKRVLRVRHYLRYADDFIFLSEDRRHLELLIPQISEFLLTDLHMHLHPKKIVVRSWRQGIDFLGYISFPHYALLRSRTRARVQKKVRYRCRQLGRGEISEKELGSTLSSYYGMLRHCRGRGVHDALQEILQKYELIV